MKLYKTLSISIFITSLLLCGNAFAKPSEVKVVNMPDVTVINDETNPVPVKVQERTIIPFQLRDRSDIDKNSTGFSAAGFEANSLPDSTVPAGYRAVLTHASVEICADKTYSYPAGTIWSWGMSISVTSDGLTTVSASQQLGSTPTTFVGPGLGFACVVVGTISQPLNLIVQAGGLLTYYFITRNYTGADENFTVAIQGYLEKVSTP